MLAKQVVLPLEFQPQPKDNFFMMLNIVSVNVRVLKSPIYRSK
jgi:hypothetical protein